MSRIGKNYLQVGFYTEILFPDKGVRFIAVNKRKAKAAEAGKELVNTSVLNLRKDSWLPGHARRNSNPIAAHVSGQLLFGHPLSTSWPVPIDRGVVAHLWTVNLDGSTEVGTGRIHRISDPGHRSGHHGDNCRFSGRIIRFYLVVSRKTE